MRKFVIGHLWLWPLIVILICFATPAIGQRGGRSPSVLGGGIGGDADTLDGLDSSQFLRSDQQDESSAGIYVKYPYFDVKHSGFGAVGNGIADDQPAIVLAHIAATASGGRIFFPQGTYKLSDDLTINANVTLEFSPGAILSIDNTKTVTINGHIADTVHQIFSGAGSVAGRPRNDFVRPEWWGAVADGTTVCTSAIHKAIDFVAEDSASIGTVRFLAGRYVIDASEVAVSTGADLAGTWTFTQTSTTVTTVAGGVAEDRLYPGLWVKVSTSSTWYEVASITSDDEFELVIAFGETTVTDTTNATNSGVKAALAFDAAKDGVRLVGEIAAHAGTGSGAGTQIYFAGTGGNAIGVDTYGIHMAGCGPWVFENIQFSGNKDARPAGGIFIESHGLIGFSANNRFYNCDLRYFTDSCLHIRGVFRSVFRDTYFSNARIGVIAHACQLNTFIACMFQACTIGFSGSGQNISFISCDLEGNDQGILVNSGTSYGIWNSTGWLLTGLYFESMGDPDIVVLANAYDFVIGPSYVAGVNNTLKLATGCHRAVVTNWDGDVFIHTNAGNCRILSASGTVTNNDSDSYELNDLLHDDGTTPLTADWDVGAFDIVADRLKADLIQAIDNSGTPTFGDEILVNPTFDVNTDGWTDEDADLASIVGGQSNNCLEIDNTLEQNGRAWQSFSTDPGAMYRFECYYKIVVGALRVYIGTAENNSDIWSSGSKHETGWTYLTHDFVAIDTTTWITLLSIGVSTSVNLFDEVSVKRINSGNLVVGDHLGVGGSANIGGIVQLGNDTNNFTTADDGFVTLSGTARASIDIKFPVTRLKKGGVHDPAETVDGITYVLSFDKTADEEVFATAEIPHAYSVDTDILAHFHWSPNDGDAGNVTWAIEYHIMRAENNEVLTGATTTAIIVDATQSLQDECLISGNITISGTGVLAEDLIHIRIFRDANASEIGASDSFDDDANLIAFHLEIMVSGFGSDSQW